MEILFILAVLGVVGTGFAVRPACVRRLRKRQLLLAESRVAHAKRVRQRQEEVDALFERQRRHFTDIGIKLADERRPPRAADTGTIHLAPKIIRSATDAAIWHGESCRHGCGVTLVKLWEVAPSAGRGTGVIWEDIGTYCSTCGAWNHPGAYPQHFKAYGPLGSRLMMQTNLFDVLGIDGKEGSPETEWKALTEEEGKLQRRLGVVRSRRLALAEQLGLSNGDGPYRPMPLTDGNGGTGP